MVPMATNRTATPKPGTVTDSRGTPCPRAEADETSSSTCTSAVGRKRTERYGAWFDGYEAEKPTRSYVIDTFDGESQR